MSTLDARIARLPTRPGVYLFLGGGGEILYVGKAVNLRARVRQYFSGQDGRAMVPFLVRDVEDVQVVLVETEKEALILENTLIKKHQPRYNARLRDDKNFLHLRLDPREAWPRYTLVRRIRNDGARYFGPFHSAARARQTLDALERYFPLRTCTDTMFRGRSRPCLLCQMGRCGGACAGRMTPEEYREVVEESSLFLQGRSRELLDRLRERMASLAEAERFEEAARIRDLVRSMETTVERQRVVDPRLGDRDVWGVYREGDQGMAAILPVRGGHMQDPVVRRLEGVLGEDAELLAALLNQHYDPPSGADLRGWIPPEVVVPVDPEGRPALEEVLGERRGGRVHLRVPQRGDKAHLVDLAVQNARERFLQATDEDERRRRALEALARVCRLRAPPRRVECFDNSNLQGTDPVASMVVFVDGKPARAEYRRYRVKTVEGADDYATMREILGRRFTRGRTEGNLPDLVVVDGGRGQLSAARAVLAELGLPDQPVVGLVKPRTEHRKGRRSAVDRVVLPDVRDPVALRPQNPALRLLQHLRDESHAHAVRYHRKVRNRRTLGSVLDDLPGVGPTRKQALLARFGSARAVAEASEAQLATVPGIGPATARRIREAFATAAGGSAAPPVVEPGEG